MLERFGLMFRYELWANRRTLASIEAAQDRGSTVRLFAHIVAAQEVWLTRLLGSSSDGVPIWPTRTVAECKDALEAMNARIESYLADLDEEALNARITYSNQTGRTFEHMPLDILTHLGLHSQHHRGQIALQLRQLGQEPAVTDFIAYLREN